MSQRQAPGADDWLPESADLETLRAAAQECRGCELYKGTTQAVLGEGALDARVVLVGEQPGDQEDRQGHPFVGPAGRLLDKALDEVGIKRDDAFVTNAVKHFRFRREGKRRIHQSPAVSHIRACRPWFDAELALTRPRVVVGTQGRVRRLRRRSRGRRLDDGLTRAGVAVGPSNCPACQVPETG